MESALIEVLKFDPYIIGLNTVKKLAWVALLHSLYKALSDLDDMIN